MKIVRKKEGSSAEQSCKVGFMVCKPIPGDEENLNLKLKKKKNDLKTISKTLNLFLKATQMNENMNRTSQTADSFNIINE